MSVGANERVVLENEGPSTLISFMRTFWSSLDVFKFFFCDLSLKVSVLRRFLAISLYKYSTDIGNTKS